MRIILADTETTGVSTSDAVCEVAYMEIDANLDVISSGASLINPGLPIHYAASAVNGITDEMVAFSPTLAEYLASKGNPLRGEDVVLVCHNVAFDHRFLKDYMNEGATTLCTLKIARALYPEAANHKQSTIAAMLGIQVAREKAHSADGDLDVLLQMLRCMCRDAETDIAGLLEIQSRPRQIKTMPFGKHKGVALKELPRSYVTWLLGTANIDEDLKLSLQAL